MARRILQIFQNPEKLLDLSNNELALALLEDMQAREVDPIGGMANRDSLGAAIVTPSMFALNASPRELQSKLDRAGRAAYDQLERNNLAEAAPGINGRNGYISLTALGRSTTQFVNLEHVRTRGLLKEEKLHSALRGKVFTDFAADELDSAVLEAFKIVEIEVRSAASLPAREHGRQLMQKAFAFGGPLAKPADTKGDCDALFGLFAGALSRFRNPGAHSKRTFADVLEAMEELMFASRLLRIVDERR